MSYPHNIGIIGIGRVGPALSQLCLGHHTGLLIMMCVFFNYSIESYTKAALYGHGMWSVKYEWWLPFICSVQPQGSERVPVQS